MYPINVKMIELNPVENRSYGWCKWLQL